MTDKSYTLITGASSGIGKELAFHCGSLGMNLLLVSLPGEKLEDVSIELKNTYNIKTDFLETDLSKLDSPEEVFEWTKKNNYPVRILINNAGLAGTVVFEKSDLSYNDHRILVNIRALVLLTRLFIPVLKTHDKSYILNVGSLSAFFSIPYKSLYSSTKAFVVNFSRALRYELKNTSISVSVLCPNGVRTNAGTNLRISSHGKIAQLTIIRADKVARIAIKGIMQDKFLIIPGLINRVIYVLNKILPVSIQQKILVREFLKEVKVS